MLTSQLRLHSVRAVHVYMEFNFISCSPRLRPHLDLGSISSCSASVSFLVPVSLLQLAWIQLQLYTLPQPQFAFHVPRPRLLNKVCASHCGARHVCVLFVSVPSRARIGSSGTLTLGISLTAQFAFGFTSSTSHLDSASFSLVPSSIRPHVDGVINSFCWTCALSASSLVRFSASTSVSILKSVSVSLSVSASASTSVLSLRFWH